MTWAVGARSRISSLTRTRGRSSRSSRTRGSPLPPASTYAAPATPATQAPKSPRAQRVPRVARRRGGLALGLSTLYLSVIVLIPLAAVTIKAVSQSPSDFWQAVTNPLALRALGVTLGAALLSAAIGAVMGTLVAFVLIRDEFPGKRFINGLIDLPFALPTIVAGLALLALYGPDSPFGVHLAYTRAVVVVALLFVTLPFVVRSVQPVLLELDREVEEAAASLGASNAVI